MEADVAPNLKSLLERPGRASLPAKSVLHPDADEPDGEYRAFANGRVGNRPQLSVIFRKADGSARAFTYTHLLSVEAENPNEGFMVEFSSQKVVVRGRNLEHLFRLVCQHKAAEIVEASQVAALQIPSHAPVVEVIEYRKNNS